MNRQRTAEIIAAIHNFAGFGTRRPITADRILTGVDRDDDSTLSAEDAGAIVDMMLAENGKG